MNNKERILKIVELQVKAKRMQKELNEMMKKIAKLLLEDIIESLKEDEETNQGRV